MIWLYILRSKGHQLGIHSKIVQGYLADWGQEIVGQGRMLERTHHQIMTAMLV